MALLGVRRARSTKIGKLLISWSAVSIILLLIPWNLQRRFITGLYVPLSGLTVYGLQTLRESIHRWRTLVVVSMFIIALPTNLIVLISGFAASMQKDPQIYIKTSYLEALSWLSEFTAKDSLIIANEKIGLLIPSFTGRNVIYGHPFETINAIEEKSFIEDYFNGDYSAKELKKLTSKRKIDYILTDEEFGAGEELEKWKDLGYPTVYQSGGIVILDVIR
jgi:hypothetical protein